MKRVIAGLALALAVGAYAAHPQTLNKEGFVGVNKTQSGQSLGHSKLAFFALMDYADGYNNLNGAGTTDPRWGEVSKFMGLSANVGFALGIWHYFDVGMALPVFYDNFSLPIKDPTSGEIANDDGRKTGGIGNLKADLKARFPLPEDQPMDVAVFFSAAFPTADQNKQGLWIRELEYINKETGEGHAFGTSSTTMKFGLAATADFSKLDGGEGLPFLIHVNGGYRYTSSDGSVYLGVPFVSAAAEYYFIDFLSIFAEYFMDIQTEKFNGVFNNNVDENLEMQQLTGAVVFHTPVGLDIHLGASYYVGGDNMVSNIVTWQNEERQGENAVILEKTRVNPEYTVYGGLTWSGFLLPQDRDGDGVTDNEDKCPDDKGHRLNQGCPLGNPDSDEDGVCDAWVAEKGFEDEFSDICEGVDECPNEPGEGEDGCELDDPDPDKDGVCDPWVSQKKMTKKFKDVCDGIDECPAQPGPIEFNGCKTKQPDPDGDGMCSPWVIDEGVASSFSNVCAGYDMCPGEAGTKANKGCPWDDPDVDGDGLCDAWVTEKKMGYYFEKAAEDQEIAKKWFIEKSCKGIDKCPTESGPANNEGCPLGEPDTDGDGLCDAWVSEKKMLDQFDDIC
ncbi:MAG: OmpA family protein, partial [Fibrobacter sp.]|nr:OmpA family protein [Fibrobacter sp.]